MSVPGIFLGWFSRGKTRGFFQLCPRPAESREKESFSILPLDRRARC
ncbi:hypothetical protein HMPREF9436_00198 [Faecalibacterium cf. prausnitzii KLE1255]|uniref:Uncharacterized protein n=1 Tax=Faecalibacterium cf. prausnitzii KLE1255 TaxID=748224 RepID=E2ZEW9_9FIRM|nr:hypothetical protein HMPREF9436_00198 [Faecalibacterium cf. prausnitzii KLE1255]